MTRKRDDLRRVRRSAGLSQEDLAYRLGVDTSTVWRWEAGRTEPEAWLQPRLAKALGVTQAELRALLAPMPPPAETVPNGDGHQMLMASVRDPAGAPDESVVVAVLGPSRTLALLDDLVVSLISRYELEGPHRLAAEARAIRRLAGTFGNQITSPAERLQLARVTARQSALLAYMSVNLSQFAAAERYALEATVLATAAGDRRLQAWIKGTQSFGAYYQQRYTDAANLARSGLQLTDDPGQRVRLLSNGLARAAGKLGDRPTVEWAVHTAFELAAGADLADGMTPCIDFAPYSWARTAANAATAYLSVGDYAQALELTQQVSAIVASSESDWSRSLVQLDEANALTLGSYADLEHAATLGSAALDGAASKPIASVGTRAAELAAGLHRHGPHRAGDEFAARLRDWHQQARTLPA